MKWVPSSTGSGRIALNLSNTIALVPASTIHQQTIWEKSVLGNQAVHHHKEKSETTPATIAPVPKVVAALSTLSMFTESGSYSTNGKKMEDRRRNLNLSVCLGL